MKWLVLAIILLALEEPPQIPPDDTVTVRG